ncbi:hypothetical protein SYNPS1DRAFT_30769 [Syncephalis pseudoplumigaleata]|uniref:Uncharacterized protein n=1 Tax=Syncephalis pseudoplumigaleata TaxID=1712513 RepID=A0A4P9YTZ5_9FUNG|nr:hypothetical protein SYNPS1DRAFT_30769 [Syncephalis pseudoplumigaleata]|eukprot:RKP23483.1 hypothetical protein SYNPS1DRAFT_30769 [Syncephalis pseudoplumigaleata]
MKYLAWQIPAVLAVAAALCAQSVTALSASNIQCLINKELAPRQKRLFTHSPALAKLALQHSIHMAREERMTNERFPGESDLDKAANEIDPNNKVKNIGLGTLMGYKTDEDIVRALKQSPGSFQAPPFDGSRTHFGIAFARAEDGTLYTTYVTGIEPNAPEEKDECRQFAELPIPTEKKSAKRAAAQ